MLFLAHRCLVSSKKNPLAVGWLSAAVLPWAALAIRGPRRMDGSKADILPHSIVGQRFGLQGLVSLDLRPSSLGQVIQNLKSTVVSWWSVSVSTIEHGAL